MRFALVVEYCGTAYHGFQYQQDYVSIQAKLQEALSKIANHPVTVVAAGRTDQGVHALAQVVHFDTNAIRPLSAWMMGANTELPADIRIKKVIEVPAHFHARRSALSRRYQYWIQNSQSASALLIQRMLWHYRPLDEHLMQQAADYLIGTHDFSSFRGPFCQANTPVKTVYHCQVTRQGEWLTVDIKANGFLHHMVRNIVGGLLQVGEQRKPPVWMAEVLDAKNRQAAGVKVAPDGLYLTEIEYPLEFNLLMR